MEIFEILQAKKIDIYISFFMTILGIILGLIIDVLRKGKLQRDNYNNGTINSVTVNYIVKPVSRKNNSPSNDDGMPFIIGFFLLIIGSIYLFNRLEILNSIYYVTVFIISLWSGGILHSLFKGCFTGWRWYVNLIFYGVFFAASFFIVNKAISPNYAPENFKFSQQLINDYGIFGLKYYFTVLDFRWFLFHLIGVILLFLAMFRVTLSTTYFAIMGGYIFSSSEKEKEPWLAKKTRKYSQFWLNIIIVSILLFASYYLVSGDFFMWFEYVFPEETTSFINKALHGG